MPIALDLRGAFRSKLSRREVHLRHLVSDSDQAIWTNVGTEIIRDDLRHLWGCAFSCELRGRSDKFRNFHIGSCVLLRKHLPASGWRPAVQLRLLRGLGLVLSAP